MLNLLRYGIKNAVAVEGTHIPRIIVDLCEKKTATAFFDGDRGGELILRELLQVTDIDFVAFSPKGKSVEDMTRKEVIKTLRNKVPVEYIRDHYAENSEDSRVQPISNKEGGEPEGKVKIPPGSKKTREGNKEPLTLQDHIEDVKGRSIARFLTEDLKVKKELKSDELEKGVDTVDSSVTGIVVDRSIDQKLLDRLIGKGLTYVAAKDFRGIIKRPLSIRLMKMG